VIAFRDNPQPQQLYSESVVSPIAIGGIVCVRVFGGALLGVVLQSALLLQGQALHMAINLGRTRLLLFENAGSSIPFPVLLVLVFWLIIFASFGLFAPRNATVVAAFLVTALPVSGAIFFILELDRSFEGILQVSSASLRAALTRLGGLCEQMAAIRPARPAPSPPAKSLRGALPVAPFPRSARRP